jgi:hypothetical protein
MLSMLCLVVVFGIHSLADWTWYVPGNACVALLCAGWLAGRGPLRTSAGDAALAAAGAPAGSGAGEAAMAAAERPHGAATSSPNAAATATAPDGETTLIVRPGGLHVPKARELRARLSPSALGPLRIGVAVAIVVGTLLAAWAQWQPQRSADASQQALTQLSGDPSAAASSAQAAVSRDPLSAQALFTLSAVQHRRREPALARATLQRAVRLQPSNPQTWLTLGEYDLATKDPIDALHELEAAIYLNPESINPEAIAQGNPEAIAIQNAYVEASRAASAQAAAAAAARKHARRAQRRRAAHRAKARRAAAAAKP